MDALVNDGEWISTGWVSVRKGSPPYRPGPDTIARIAELLSLTQSMDGTAPADVDQVRQRIIASASALQREPHPGGMAEIREHIADLQRQEGAMLAAIAKAAPDFRRANQLALHLAMELPAGLWRAVAKGASAGNVAGIWGAVDAVRDTVGADGQLTGEDVFWAQPGLGQHQAQEPSR